MTPENTNAIAAFLDELQSTNQGAAMMVNMLDSHAEGLISSDCLAVFLVDCAVTHSATPSPGIGAVIVVQDVSCGQGVNSNSYLRQAKQTPFPAVGPERLSNTTKTQSFHRFFLDQKYKDASRRLPVILPPVPVNSPNGAKDYSERLSQVTADPMWHKPDAALGKPLPEPSNCWVTTDQFAIDLAAPNYDNDNGTKARDELGLIDTDTDSFLLRISFSASTVGNSPSTESARPTFADLGNSRFKVRDLSSRAQVFKSMGWGATAHLGKIGNSSFTEITGVSERVTSALSVSTLGSISVELLGRVSGKRGKTTTNDDEAFLTHILAGRSIADIRSDLLSLVA